MSGTASCLHGAWLVQGAGVTWAPLYDAGWLSGAAFAMLRVRHENAPADVVTQHRSAFSERLYFHHTHQDPHASLATACFAKVHSGRMSLQGLTPAAGLVGLACQRALGVATRRPSCQRARQSLGTDRVHRDDVLCTAAYKAVCTALLQATDACSLRTCMTRCIR
jgi:hypothetical protein